MTLPTYRAKQIAIRNVIAALLGLATLELLIGKFTKAIYALGPAPTNHAVKLALVQVIQDLLTTALDLPDNDKPCKAIKAIHDAYPAQKRGRKVKA